jgi:hypothetical protein
VWQQKSFHLPNIYHILPAPKSDPYPTTKPSFRPANVETVAFRPVNSSAVPSMKAEAAAFRADSSADVRDQLIALQKKLLIFYEEEWDGPKPPPIQVALS